MDNAVQTQIELVVFDLGRVLVRICNDWFHACELVGVKPPPRIVDRSQPLPLRELVHKVEAGEVSFDQFVEGAAEIVGASPQQIVAASEAFVIGLYAGVPELIEQLHAAGIATACLSNTNSHHWGLMSDPKHPSFFPLNRLKYQFASHLIRARKPDAEIYAHLEQQTGLKGKQILFFDDVRENVDAAVRRGWNAQWIDPALNDPIPQIRSSLRRYGILPPDRA